MQIDPLLRALADPTRLRIMRLLSAMELAVGELAQVLGQSQPRVSRHIRILCEAGLAERRKETLGEQEPVLRALTRRGWARREEGGELLHLTPEGLATARRIVRNHRLWELYLTNIAHFEQEMEALVPGV